MAKLDGSCLCGKVTYSSEAEPVATAACHCTDCQKQTGTAFSVIVAVPREALRIDGEEHIGAFTTVGTDTGKEVSRRFCRECGSPVFSFADIMPQLAFIKAGTLDDTSWLDPQMHVWTDSAHEWIPLDSYQGMKLPRGPSGAEAS
jgi:hypothetical protein